MAGLTLDGSQFKGGGGGVQLDQPGTYPCTLKGASVYKNNLYQSEETRPEITLIWDTGLVGENNDGEEVPVYVYDSFINLSLNEKAKFVNRLTALMGGTLDPETARLNIGGVTDLNSLPHRKDGRTEVTSLTLNDEDLFGKEALITVTIDGDWAKVTNASPPVNAAAGTGKLKRKAAPAAAPAGAPT